MWTQKTKKINKRNPKNILQFLVILFLFIFSFNMGNGTSHDIQVDWIKDSEVFNILQVLNLIQSEILKLHKICHITNSFVL